MRKISKRFIQLFTLIFIISSIFSFGVRAENINQKASIPSVKRIGGDNRVLTSVKVSQNAYKNNSETVILVGSRGEIDALGGTLLASKLDAPIIMTDKNSLTSATKDEIERLNAKNVIILGGEGVVSKNVVNSLSKYNVERIDGDNREQTAIKIAKRAVGEITDEVFLGLGYDVYADALAIGAATAKLSKPLLLSKKSGIADETINAIKDFQVRKVTIVGGHTVVSTSIENKLKSMGLTVDRIYGNNREETSIKIAETYFKDPSEVIIANGYVFADSVVGGYYGYKKNAPIILTRKNKLVTSTLNYISKTKKDTTILGLYGAIDKIVESNLNKILKGEEIEKPEEKPQETQSQKQAIIKAKEYLEIIAFSKTGLIEMLEYDGFTNKDATYAVNNITVNWNQQAVLSAKSFLDTISFSKIGLIEMLEYDGFTNKEATYAVNNITVNWNQQSILSAKSFLDTISFSKIGLIEMLEYDGFTNKEATYAVNNITVNWKEQAVLSAKSYLEIMPFSRKELIEMLEYDGFTNVEAVYAASKMGL